jgi:hypothetical protein
MVAHSIGRWMAFCVHKDGDILKIKKLHKSFKKSFKNQERN